LDHFKNISDPDKSKWPLEKNGLCITVGVYPCDVALFAKHLPELRKVFGIKESYYEEARQR